MEQRRELDLWLTISSRTSPLVTSADVDVDVDVVVDVDVDVDVDVKRRRRFLAAISVCKQEHR